MYAFYDSLSFNSDILLDLPFREGVESTTQDVAKPHHPVTLVGGPTWTPIISGLGTLVFDGATQYAQLLNADTLDLDFTAGDYSLSSWIYWEHGSTSQQLISRYDVDVAFSGWEWYLTEYGGQFHLTLRHHHAGTIVSGHPRTGGNSLGWAQGVWTHAAVSRIGAVAQHFRNGVAVDMTYSPGGMVDPESCAEDLVIGTRFTKNTDWFKGNMWRPRVWGRALSAEEWKIIYDIEKRWFT